MPYEKEFFQKQAENLAANTNWMAQPEFCSPNGRLSAMAVASVLNIHIYIIARILNTNVTDLVANSNTPKFYPKLLKIIESYKLGADFTDKNIQQLATNNQFTEINLTIS